jgi:hypothetical protein
MIDKSKEIYKAYRDRARDLYETAAVSHDPHYIHESISVPQFANVQIVENGAFVEAIVWVPKEKLDVPRT